MTLKVTSIFYRCKNAQVLMAGYNTWCWRDFETCITENNHDDYRQTSAVGRGGFCVALWRLTNSKDEKKFLNQYLHYQSKMSWSVCFHFQNLNTNCKL